MKLNTNEEVKAVLERLDGKDFTVEKLKRKNVVGMRHFHTPPLLCRWMLPIKINFRTRKTMMVAQQLYEGINIGSGVQGLITYMRTDSTRISPVAQNEAANFIVDRFGEKYSKHGSR